MTSHRKPALLFTVVLVLALIITILRFEVSAETLQNLRLIFLVTDQPDHIYVKEFLTHVKDVRAKVVNLEELIEMKLVPKEDVVVLTDPNWDPSEIELIRALAFKLRSFVERGGVVVATLNGVVLLKEAMPFLPLPTEKCKYALPPMYNITKYKCISFDVHREVHSVITTQIVSIGNTTVYVYRYERNLVIIPLNLVWAYVDTKNLIYIRILDTVLRECISYTSQRVRTVDSYTAMAALGVVMALSTHLASHVSSRVSKHEHHKGPQKHPIVPIVSFWIPPDMILKHPVRAKIMNIIEREGATYLSKLCRNLKVPKAVVSWHLEILRKYGLVKVVRYKRELLFYVDELKLIEFLVKNDEDFCSLVTFVMNNVKIEEISRRLRVSIGGLRDVYLILSTNVSVIEYAKRLCEENRRCVDEC